MKSHQYASKRRLTNICCIVVGLALVKLVFAGYLAAGGELFAFPSPEKEKKAQQIAEAQAKKILAYQEAAQNYEQNQRRLAQAVSGLESEEATKPNNTSDTRQSMDMQAHTNKNSINPANINSNSMLSQNATKNFALGNDRLQSQTRSRVSFLPQPRNKDTHNLVDAQNKQVNLDENNRKASDMASAKNDAQNITNQVALSEQQMQSVQHSPIAQQTYTPIERSDMVNDDLVLASASAATANSTRAQMRASLLQSAFASYENVDPHALDTINTENAHYTQNQQNQQNNQNNQSVQGQDTAHNAGRQNIASASQASFFNLVGTAYAADVPYTRPDEATSVPLPSPAVQGYSSPDSLEYKQSELNRKEEELLALQQQMNSRLKELNELEGRIGNMVQDASSMQGEKFKHLIETYTNMKARVAAQSLVTLDEDIAVRILSGMKSKQSGEIFSYMNPVQAARLSEAMAQFNL